MPENGSCLPPEAGYQRQSVNLAARLCGAPNITQSGESFAASGRMPSRPASSRLWRESGVRHCVYCLCRQRPVPYPGQRQCSARPGFAVHRDPLSGIENCQPGFSRVICAVRLPPTAYAFASRPTSWHRPVSADVTAGYIAFVDRHPAFKGERAVSRAILSCIHLPSHGFRSCHPPVARRDHCLTTPHHRANHAHLHHAVLSGKAGEAYQASARCRRGSFSQVSCGIASSAADRMASEN